MVKLLVVKGLCFHHHQLKRQHEMSTTVSLDFLKITKACFQNTPGPCLTQILQYIYDGGQRFCQLYR